MHLAGTLRIGVEGAPGVEVGVRQGDRFYAACTTVDGDFFVRQDYDEPLEYGQVEIRLRSALGEKVAPLGCGKTAYCNDCHFPKESLKLFLSPP
jgi:hypothetical protein